MYGNNLAGYYQLENEIALFGIRYPFEAIRTPRKEETPMAKSSGNKGGGSTKRTGGSGKGGNSGAGWPSKTGNRSGGSRANAPSKRK